MQVRYQTAPRSDTIYSYWLVTAPVPQHRGEIIRPFVLSAPQDPHHVFELHAHLAHDLLALGNVGARVIAGELLSRAADGEALLVEQAADLADDDHVLALIVAAIAAALDRLELRKLLLPIAQHVRFHAAQFTHLADGEVAFAGDRRQLVIIPCFQHRL